MRIVFPLILSVFTAGAAMANPPLGAQPRITEGLIAVAMAYEIGRVCPDLSSRRLRGISYLLSLKSLARDMGYSNAQIDAFVADRGEKARLEGEARARLAAMGAAPGQPQSYCAVGRAEIARDSAVGRLLR